MNILNLQGSYGLIVNRARNLVSRFVIPRLAKFTRVPPFRFGTTSLWPGTYIAYMPDRYSADLEKYRVQGGEFDCRHFGNFIRNNELNNSGDMPRYLALSLICDQILKEKLSGDVAELGVYKGNTAVLLAALARKLGSTAYLLDTYEGFSPDDLKGIDANKPYFFTDSSLVAVQSLVGCRNVQFVKGHFPYSSSEMPAGLRYCLVHIDCDLYAPVDAALRYFYPRLITGGFLVIHDYLNFCWNGVGRAVDEFFADKPEKLVPIPDKSGTAVIRKL